MIITMRQKSEMRGERAKAVLEKGNPAKIDEFKVPC